MPLYIYLPPRLRYAGYPRHSDVYADHYDILPTIAPYAFKGTDYMCLGYSVINPGVDHKHTFSYNELQTLAAPDYMPTARRKAAARELLLYLYFQDKL